MSGTIELEGFLRDHPDTVAIDAFVIDVNGQTLGKRIPVNQANTLAESGVSFSAASLLLDSRGIGQNPGGRGRSDGDPDSTYMPVQGTLKPVPWARRKMAQWLCEPVSEPATDLDPRKILRDALTICRRDQLTPIIAFELEFYLLDGRRDSNGLPYPAPISRTARCPSASGGLSLERIEELDDILTDIEVAAKAQGVSVSGFVTECGIQQVEVNMPHTDDVIKAADGAVMLRRLVQGVARARGLDATFMAQPYMDQASSGLHMHVSLVDEHGENLFAAPHGKDMLHSAIAGLQELYEESLALFSPNLNSHRRLGRPFAPSSPTWGQNDRSVAFRIPLSSASATRIEHRVAGADASPHLALAAVLSGIHYGVTNSLLLDYPLDNKRKAGKVGSGGNFPGSLFALENASVLSQYLPPSYLRLYASLKRAEYQDLMKDYLHREHEFYL